jgi:predicted O-methyltransferase YrrM
MSDQASAPARCAPGPEPLPGFDTGHAHSARIYNYWLGGKDNFAADREAAELAIAANPGIVADVRANRAFLARVVRYLARECGIRQFLDIGTGLPTAGNTHEVAQEAAPDARIVYVDNDPVVLAYARALLTSTPEGATRYLHADLRDRADAANHLAPDPGLRRPARHRGQPRRCLACRQLPGARPPRE